jgi:hypothetical protein
MADHVRGVAYVVRGVYAVCGGVYVVCVCSVCGVWWSVYCVCSVCIVYLYTQTHDTTYTRTRISYTLTYIHS